MVNPTRLNPSTRRVWLPLVLVVVVSAAGIGGCASSSSPESSGAAGGEARQSDTPTHYAFAHQFLRMVFYDEPELFLKRLQDSDAEEIILDGWKRVAETTRTSIHPSASDFAVHTARNESAEQTTYLAIVEFPEPRQVTHAFMVGMICRPPDGTLRPQESPCRYYTLEKSAAELLAEEGEEEPGPETSMGAWTEKPVKHLNFRAAPPAEVPAFQKAVEEHFERYLDDEERPEAETQMTRRR